MRSSSTTSGSFISKDRDVYWNDGGLALLGRNESDHSRNRKPLPRLPIALQHGFNDDETSYLGIGFKPGYYAASPAASSPIGTLSCRKGSGQIVLAVRLDLGVPDFRQCRYLHHPRDADRHLVAGSGRRCGASQGQLPD